MTTYEPRCPALHPGLPYSRCAREKGHGMLHCNASGNTWDYSSDLMDGGVTAALIDQEAEPDLRVDYEAMWWKAESRAEEALAAVSETEGRVTAARERTEEIREELRNADQLILVERARAERAEKERDEARRERDSWRAQVPLAEWEKELIRATENPRPLTADDIEAVLHDVLPLTTARLGDEDIAEIAFNLHAALAEPTPEPTAAEVRKAQADAWDGCADVAGDEMGVGGVSHAVKLRRCNPYRADEYETGDQA